ncbi:MAG: dTDP-4-dehydrorhamnose reductase [Pseudomonadota bacterium]
MGLCVIGRQGQVATALAEAAAARGTPLAVLARPEIDLAAPHTIAPALDHLAPSVVVNAAAYTAVDQAESEPALAHTINAESPHAMAAWCAARGARFIHLSTDYVFDGNGTRPYREDDPVAPKSAYGRTKLAGEAAVAAAGGHSLIVRTAWVYAPFGKNFVRTMLRLGAERDSVSVVSDQHGTPTSALDIADALLALAARPDWGSAPEVFHLAGQGETTWHSFAHEIFRRASLTPAVQAIPTSHYPTPAARPRYSVLDCGKLFERFGIVLPPWRDSLATVVDRLTR